MWKNKKEIYGEEGQIARYTCKECDQYCFCTVVGSVKPKQCLVGVELWEAVWVENEEKE